MLFRFSATLPLREIFDASFAMAYLSACVILYLIVISTGLVRREGLATSALESQCSIIGNTGFLGLPMLVAILGHTAAGPILLTLAIDLIVFSSLAVMIITMSREGRFSARSVLRIIGGVFKNPMVVSMCAGILWSALRLPLVAPFDAFLQLLGGAATPAALFAIGASLAFHKAGRIGISVWLASAKLLLHPLLVAIFALLVFSVEPYAAGVMIAAAAMPTAGNIYLLANHYRVAEARVSSVILISTCASILTLSIVISLVPGQ